MSKEVQFDGSLESKEYLKKLDALQRSYKHVYINPDLSESDMKQELLLLEAEIEYSKSEHCKLMKELHSYQKYGYYKKSIDPKMSESELKTEIQECKNIFMMKQIMQSQICKDICDKDALETITNALKNISTLTDLKEFATDKEKLLNLFGEFITKKADKSTSVIKESLKDEKAYKEFEKCLAEHIKNKQ